MLFFLDQHGCAKNQVDGELIIGHLRAKGWERTEDPDRADLIIVNSCGFIESAKTESIDAVMTAHSAHPRAKVLLAGCLAERYADDLSEGLTEAVITSYSIHYTKLYDPRPPIPPFSRVSVCAPAPRRAA